MADAKASPMKAKTLILFLALAGLLPLAARAQLTYTTNNGAITITGYTGSPTNIVIPASTNGYPITKIATNAFSGSGLLNVIIPASVTNIGQQVFYFCNHLTNIVVDSSNPVYSSTNGVLFNKAQTILIQFPGGRAGSYTVPNGVISIGNYAFSQCHSLTNVTIPDSVTNILDYAFYYCGLWSVTIGNSVTSIGNYAFCDCNSLMSVTIPNSVTSIGGFYAFGYDRSLRNVIIGNHVTNIGSAAFQLCTSLTSVTIPSSVTSIGNIAFNLCNQLTNIVVDAANPTYSSTNGVLFDKAQTTLIQFPGGLGGNYTIPNSVTNLGNYAFGNCTTLTSVTIPNSVANIDSISFYICTGLTNITFLGNAPTFVILPGIPYDFTTWGVSATIYYYYGTSGWSTTYGGLTTIMLGAPAPQIGGGGSIGVQSGNFSFTVAGANNQTIVVEVSTNLVDWQPVWTNTLSGASATFTDSQWTNYPARFYRAR
jgi:hypothetical protein